MDGFEDPLMPARLRFPMVAASVDRSDEQPSELRPFVLRGAPVITPREIRHRTPAHQTTIPQPTTLDNRVQDDSYSVPDD